MPNVPTLSIRYIIGEGDYPALPRESCLVFDEEGALHLATVRIKYHTVIDDGEVFTRMHCYCSSLKGQVGRRQECVGVASASRASKISSVGTASSSSISIPREHHEHRPP